ncbi:MAG: hypothetical protein RLZZ524_762 [Pseudomonadota bacterium]|jgi:hypothetical protein
MEFGAADFLLVLLFVGMVLMALFPPGWRL